MIDCLILGDSIAVGTQQFAPQCQLIGKGGINSWQFNKMYTQQFEGVNIVISMGSNDHSGVKTQNELESLRARVTAKGRVYWILPAIKPPIQEIVRNIAAKNNDTVLPITKLQADGVHPSWAGYKELASVVAR